MMKKKRIPRPVRIPKLVYQDRDFGEIDKFMRCLEMDEVSEANGDIVAIPLSGEMYRVIPAMRNWAEFFTEMAEIQGDATYSDAPMQTMMDKLSNDEKITMALVGEVKRVVEHQRQIYMKAPNGIINRVAYSKLEGVAV